MKIQADVLMFNQEGFLTETTIYNIAIQKSASSKWVTPPLKDGLLDGTARRFMIDQDILAEGRLTASDLPPATSSPTQPVDSWPYPRLVAFNSVRGVRPAILVSNVPPQGMES